MRSVLVTGGSGSFGQAFTRRLLSMGVERIVILSRGEHKQAEMAEAFAEHTDRLRFFIGDVRDVDRLRTAFRDVEFVVHAAALKRIEVGQYNPAELVKTNVLGTMNVIEAAHDAGVMKVVGLSSDKAFFPRSPYGQSKALAEMLLLNANNTRGRSGPIYAVTRYGNVWNSAGSVGPRWRAILNTAKILIRHSPSSTGVQCAVPVSDPECTRFMMTMDQAVDLVLTAIETMNGGERFIPPDLPAYRLGDLAEAFDADMIVSGLPDWEKLHEGLADGYTSDKARRMTVAELREIIAMGDRL